MANGHLELGKDSELLKPVKEICSTPRSYIFTF